MLTTYKRRKNTLLWLSTETNCDCAIWSKTAIWNARREGETYGCGPVRPVSPPGPAKDAVCIGRTVQKTANSTTANRRLLDTLFLSTAVHGLVHCPLVLACRHAAVGDVASTRAVVQPRQRKIRCRASDARKKKAVLGSAKKAKLLDHAPALASQRPSFPGLVAMAWPCTLLASMLTRRTVIVHSVCLASCHWLLPGSSETWRRGGVPVAAAQ